MKFSKIFRTLWTYRNNLLSLKLKRAGRIVSEIQRIKLPVICRARFSVKRSILGTVWGKSVKAYSCEIWRYHPNVIMQIDQVQTFVIKLVNLIFIPCHCLMSLGKKYHETCFLSCKTYTEWSGLALKTCQKWKVFYLLRSCSCHLQWRLRSKAEVQPAYLFNLDVIYGWLVNLLATDFFFFKF